MTPLLIIFSIMIGGILLAKYGHNYKQLGPIGIFLFVIGLFCFTIHLPLWLGLEGDYEEFVTERDAFIQTIENARESNVNPYESAAILSEIAEWNVRLASKKRYLDRNFMTKYYCDERFRDLKPIK